MTLIRLLSEYAIYIPMGVSLYRKFQIKIRFSSSSLQFQFTEIKNVFQWVLMAIESINICLKCEIEIIFIYLFAIINFYSIVTSLNWVQKFGKHIKCLNLKKY